MSGAYCSLPECPNRSKKHGTANHQVERNHINPSYGNSSSIWFLCFYLIHFCDYHWWPGWSPSDCKAFSCPSGVDPRFRIKEAQWLSWRSVQVPRCATTYYCSYTMCALNKKIQNIKTWLQYPKTCSSVWSPTPRNLSDMFRTTMTRSTSVA